MDIFRKQHQHEQTYEIEKAMRVDLRSTSTIATSIPPSPSVDELHTGRVAYVETTCVIPMGAIFLNLMRHTDRVQRTKQYVPHRVYTADHSSHCKPFYPCTRTISILAGDFARTASTLIRIIRPQHCSTRT